MPNWIGHITLPHTGKLDHVIAYALRKQLYYAQAPVSYIEMCKQYPAATFYTVFNTADLDVTGHRWISSLASFKFNILFRSGNRKNNDDENSLSR